MAEDYFANEGRRPDDGVRLLEGESGIFQLIAHKNLDERDLFSFLICKMRVCVGYSFLPDLLPTIVEVGERRGKDFREDLYYFSSEGVLLSYRKKSGIYGSIQDGFYDNSISRLVDKREMIKEMLKGFQFPDKLAEDVIVGHLRDGTMNEL
jgi:hypothetical protein